MSTKTKNPEETAATVPSHITLTIKSGNTGQFDFSGATITVTTEAVVKLAEGNGFEGEVRSLLGSLDKHPLFGNFAGEKEVRPKGYKRGDVQYSDERAEVVRAMIAKGTDLTGHIAVTVTQYVDSALLVTAKKSIARKDTETERTTLARKAGYAFEGEWDKVLTVDNADFVRAVAVLHSSI